MSNWRDGEPIVAGYYLATWMRRGLPTVSELWFNPNTGWFASRGYLNRQAEGMSEVIGTVCAWMPLPPPFRQAFAPQEA